MSLDILLVPNSFKPPPSWSNLVDAILDGATVVPRDSYTDPLVTCVASVVPFAEEVVLTPSFVGVARRVEGAVIVSLDWVRVATAGSGVAACARRHEHRLYVPDAASFGEDSFDPDWRRLQVRGLEWIRRMWDEGHGRAGHR